MGRTSVFLGIWLAGYVLGVVGYLAIPLMTGLLLQIIPQIFSSGVLAGAFVTGLATSIIAVVSATLWAYLSR